MQSSPALNTADDNCTQWQVLECQDPALWDNFVREQTDCLYYRWQFGQIIKAVFGHRICYLTAQDSTGAIKAALPLVEMKSLLFGHFALSMPFLNYGGVLATDKDACSALLLYAEQWAKNQGISHLTLRESETKPELKWACQQHKIAMLLKLPETADQLWKDIGSKRRAQIKRPKKEGAVVKQGGIELLDDFYSVFCKNMRDLGTPVYGKSWFEAILQAFPEQCHLIVVILDNQPVAACFLIRHGDTIDIPWASSLREVNRFGVNMLQYWEALEYSIEQGCKYFDFGRSNKGAPTVRFKKQWGAEEKQLHWYQWTPEQTETVRIDPHSGKFSLATKIWQKLPLPLANALGPMIVKNIP